jgi:hypothetical protein
MLGKTSLGAGYSNANHERADGITVTSEVAIGCKENDIENLKNAVPIPPDGD